MVGDDESALTALSCTSNPGVSGFTSTCSNFTQVQFVGKNSPNPNLGVNLKGDDLHDFAPAIGFSWNVPWFGKGKTVLRSGYGINYPAALRNFITVDNTVGTVPGINLVGSGWHRSAVHTQCLHFACRTSHLPIPLPPGTQTTVPFVIPTTDRSLTISTYNRTSPYIQNWNLEIQREIAHNTTVEVRYLGTKGTKLWGNY